ncbi:MAG: carbohydrate-binding domain-containing protein [Lachnospiraceae bacterium]|nr:carbohydrate-binding domain-containing protein [Lachnospiraceae bacterium]
MMKMMKKIWNRKQAAVMMSVMLMMSGCGAETAPAQAGTAAAEKQAAPSKEVTAGGSREVDVTVSAAEYLSTATEAGTATEELFTDRDLEGSYDAEKAVTIRLSDSGSDVDGSGAVAQGNQITITGKGTYVVTGSLSDGQIVVDAGDEKVQLVLAGAEITNDDSACIYIKSADKAFLTLAEGTENSLSDTGSEYSQTDENTTVDGVVFSKDDLTVNGSGSLAVNAGYKHGIVTKDDLKVTGGTITISAKNGKGLQGKDSVRIGGGTVTIEESKEGIEGQEIYLIDGDVSVTSSDDGLNAANKDSDSSTETATSKNSSTKADSTETGSTKSGNAKNSSTKDDSAETGSMKFGGFGPGGMMDADESCLIRIAGGSLYVNVGGDGIDSNGMLYVEGGSILVDGPVNDGNGALDYGIEGVITGGTLIAAGSAGMAEGFVDSSTQYSLLVNFDETVSGGTTVTLTDESGNTILTATPVKDYRSVVFSSPDLKQGTYTVTAGTQEVTAEIDSICTRVGQGGFGGKNGFGGRDGSGGRGGMNGERPSFGDGQTPPELPDGELPSFGDGQTPPELPDGERPSFGDGQTSPELPDGERPSFGDGQTPPERPDGKQKKKKGDAQQNGQNGEKEDSHEQNETA